MFDVKLIRYRTEIDGKNKMYLLLLSVMNVSLMSLHELISVIF